MFIIIFLGFFLNFTLVAEDTNSALIAAVVNQHAITEHELNSRIDFAIATLNMPKTKESRESLRHQVLQSLITEKLQETSAEGVKITEKEINDALTGMAKENGITIDQLKEKFKTMGVNLETLKSRLRAQISWARIVRQMYSAQVRISQSDVEKELERVKKEIHTDQYELVEIVIPIDEKSRAKSKQDADRLYSQLQRPLTNFRIIAQQFGAQSGYIGWKSVKQMDKDYADVITSMAIGSITKPVEYRNTIRIIKLLDKRRAGEGSFKSRKVVAASVRIPLPEEASEENMQILEQIVSEVKSVKSCAALQKKVLELPVEIQISEKQSLSSLPEGLQVVLDKAAVGEVVGPIQHDESSLGVFMLCSVEGAEKEKVPDEKDIKEELAQKEFGKHAVRLLNKITAAARIVIIDPENRRNTVKKAVA